MNGAHLIRKMDVWNLKNSVHSSILTPLNITKGLFKHHGFAWFKKYISIVENLQEMELIPKNDLTFWIILFPLCYFKDIEI